MEQVVYDDRAALTGSFMDYALPRADDLPHIETHTDESSPCRINPLGAKGVGDSARSARRHRDQRGTRCAATARVTDIAMPATPERVWRAIGGAGASALIAPRIAPARRPQIRKRAPTCTGCSPSSSSGSSRSPSERRWCWPCSAAASAAGYRAVSAIALLPVVLRRAARGLMRATTGAAPCAGQPRTATSRRYARRNRPAWRATFSVVRDHRAAAAGPAPGAFGMGMQAGTVFSGTPSASDPSNLLQLDGVARTDAEIGRRLLVRAEGAGLMPGELPKITSALRYEPYLLACR